MISKDVVFDELASSYGNKNVIIFYDASNGDHVEIGPQESTIIIETSYVGSLSVSPWTSRLRSHGSMSTDMDMLVRGRVDKGKGKVFDNAIRPLTLAYDSVGNGSLDSELVIPTVLTHGISQNKCTSS